MPLLDAKKLPHDFPRHFVPADTPLGHWESVQSLLKGLEDRKLGSPEDLRGWLADLLELNDCLEEEGSLRYIRMTCQTDDTALERDYLDFLEKIYEPSRPLFFALSKKYWDNPHRDSLPEKEFFLYNRSTQNELALYRDENIPLETGLAKLSQQYQKLSGSLTVNYGGKEQTLQQMARYQESTDRKVREESWRLAAARRLKEKGGFEDLFDQMLKIRVKVAQNAGFGNYRDYMFRRKERFDYGPKDCEAFHESAEKAIRPLVLKIQEKRAKKMALKNLRPWDLSVDPDGLAPLKPFEAPEELAAKCRDIFQKLDPEFGKNFQAMRDLGLLDLESRKGKAPGGYNSSLQETRLSFIFMNAVGMEGDVRTLLHEGGHAMHGFASRLIPFPAYRHAPMEFCEVASMSMELMAFPYLDVFFPNPKDSARYRIRQLENVVGLLPWIATVDAFQHWVYTHPDHTREERSAHWVRLRQRFGGMEDWSGLEEIQESLWHRQLHIFELPFYYIEYAIAQLGALQVWRNFCKDKAEGVGLYKRGLSAGGSLTLPGIFEAAGIRFDFSLQMIEPLMREVERELEGLEAAL